MINKWDYKKIGDILLVERGGSPRPIKKYITDSENGVNWIKIGDASNDSRYITRTKEKITQDGVKKSRMVYEGDFILSNSMSFGKPYIMKTSGCIHDGWLVLRKKENEETLNNDFLYHLLGSPNIFKQFNELASGSTVRNLNIRLVSSVKIPIPPLSEQKQIVETLDKAFEKIDKAIANIERNIENAEELFKSKLNQIFTEKGNDWTIKKLNEICEVKDGTHDSPKYINDNDGVPFVTQKNILNDGLSFEKVKFISKKDHESFYKRSNVAFNDILFSMIGANRGMACIVDSKKTFSIKNVGLIKSNDKFLGKFLLYYFKSPIANTYVNQNSSGSAQGFLSLTKLRSFTIPFTTLNKQSKVVESLDAIHDITKKILLIYKNRLGNLEQLKKSILEKAFKGELTNAA